MNPIPWKLLGSAFASLALFIGGFFTGRHTGKPAPQTSALIVKTGESAEIDLSPKGSASKTVIAPAVHPGKPQKPPTGDQVNQVKGEHLSTTTTTTQEAAPAGSRFQVAIYGSTTGEALKLRPIVWAETPQGLRLPVEASTTEQSITVPLVAARRPSWSASVLVELDEKLSLRPVALAQHDRGAIRFTLGAARNRAVVGLGVVW